MLFLDSTLSTNPIRCSNPYISLCSRARHLVERVGASAPVGQEQRKTNGLHDTGNSTNSDGVKGALLGENLGEDLITSQT